MCLNLIFRPSNFNFFTFWNVLKKWSLLEDWQKYSANQENSLAITFSLAGNSAFLTSTHFNSTHQLYIGDLVIWLLHSLIPVIPLVVCTCRNEENPAFYFPALLSSPKQGQAEGGTWLSLVIVKRNILPSLPAQHHNYWSVLKLVDSALLVYKQGTKASPACCHCTFTHKVCKEARRKVSQVGTRGDELPSQHPQLQEGENDH